MWNMIKHSLYDKVSKSESYQCQNRIYQSCRVDHAVLEKNNKLWFEIQIKIEDLYKSDQHSCVQLHEQQLCWECYELKIYYELHVHVEQ